MKLLLLGKNGQVGQALQPLLSPLGDLTALDRQGQANHLCGDLSQLQALADTIRQLRPDVIVNAAAYTAVDKAQTEPDHARLINALAPEVIAQEAQKLGAWLIHYSTDYVFDGSGTTPWIEADATAPLNIYGQSKQEGEQRIQAACTRHLIFRTSWVYAAHGNNFAKTMVKLAQERPKLTVIDDQWGAPTGADLIAQVTAQAISKLLAKTDNIQPGTYHLVAAGQTNWHQYASHVISQAKTLRPDLNWQVQDIAAVPSSEFATAAQRPHNSRLNCSKLEQQFGLQLPHWQQGVDQMLNEVFAVQEAREVPTQDSKK